MPFKIKTKIEPPAADASRSAKTILLIEDEDVVRALTQRLLETKGLKVLQAATLAAADSVWREEKAVIDLILADIQVTDGCTKTLVTKFRAEKLNLAVIFTSGYGEDVLSDLKGPLEGIAFIQKPFHPRELMKLLEAALEKTK